MYEHCKIEETTHKPVSGSETTGSLISLFTEQQHKCLKNVLNFFLLPSKQQKHRQLLVKRAELLYNNLIKIAQKQTSKILLSESQDHSQIG
jgi:hypothetical protein